MTGTQEQHTDNPLRLSSPFCQADNKTITFIEMITCFKDFFYVCAFPGNSVEVRGQVSGASSLWVLGKELTP